MPASLSQVSFQTPAGLTPLRDRSMTPLLAHQPEPHRGEMVVERIGDSDARPLHDGEARRIDGRQLVQVGTSKVVPGLLQIAEDGALTRRVP